MSFGADGSVAVRERRELFGGKGADQAVALNQLDREVALSVWSATTGRARTSSHDGIDVSGVVRRVGTRTSLLVDGVTNSGALQEGRLPRTPPPAPRRRWRTRCSTSAAVLTFITAVQPESTGVTAPGQSGAACRGGMGSVEAQRTALAAAAPFIGINPGTASRTAVAEEEVRSLGAQGRHRPVRLAIEAVDQGKQQGKGSTHRGVDVEGNSKDELVERAKKAGVKGYSSMNKDELGDAIARKEG